MINAAGRTTRLTIPTVSVLVLRYRLRGDIGRKGKVDNGWLSVKRQRSVCESCTGRPRCKGSAGLIVKRLCEPLVRTVSKYCAIAARERNIVDARSDGWLWQKS